TIHADLDVRLEQQGGVLGASEMAALIAVPDDWSGLRQRDTGSVQHKANLQGVIQRPTDHIAREPIQHGDQVYPAAMQADIGDVNAPDMIGVSSGHVPQQIRIDRMSLMTLTEIGSRRDTCQ